MADRPDLLPALLVTGLPASGKSTVGRELARHLGLPLLSLDTVKEAIVDTLAVEERYAVRAAAREVLLRLIPECAAGCVVDVWINPVLDETDIAKRFAAIPGVRWLEIVCRVPTELAVHRYTGRERHPAHLPADDEAISRIRVAGPGMGPLGLGPTLDVDTSGQLDLTAAEEWLADHGVRPA